ncbi:MAG: NAD(P)/FAD-dependent oxidoreductase [Schwartzia sp.]|nr:NAD(P)/FAD-dependent oxidoreductase [Schwartzia sp. (in: firmicutes)]
MGKILILGAGPAGMMAAIKAAEAGARAILLEKTERVGKKMAITGKGRCNMTNAASVPEIIKNIPGNGAFLNSALRAFDNGDVIAFFEGQGVPTVTERGGRVFPASSRAADAVDAMLRRLHELDVEIRLREDAKTLSVSDGCIRGVRLSSGKEIVADAVIVATGGASYPRTGSTGDGFRMAEAVGHTVEPPTPALVPLETEEDWPKALSGLSLKNVRIRLWSEDLQEKIGEAFGEMMFTHFGVTGPIVLTLSRSAAMHLRAHDALPMEIDLKPALDEETLAKRVQRDFEAYKNKQVKNAMVDLLPARLIAPVLDLAFVDEEKTVNQITRAERLRVVDTLKRLPLTIARTRPIDEAIVTAGGVSVRELNPKTMESKLVRGLYFAGEVADVDGFTGGYNLQAAFSMGAAAGTWAAKNCEMRSVEREV